MNRGEDQGLGGIVTFDQVEEALIEAVRLGWQSPGGGASPYASDGPWDLIRKEWNDWDARDPAKLRRLPMSRDDIKRRDVISGWLTIVGDRDRALVVRALTQLAARGEVAWERLWKALGRGRPGPDGLRKRYTRAVAAITRAINGGFPGAWAVKVRGEAD